MQKIVLQVIYGFFVRGFLKVFVGVKFDSAKFLLNEKQFIIVANHNSHLDTMTLMASVPLKLIPKVKPVAAADTFARSKWQEKLSNYFINALLIPRKRDIENIKNDPIHKMIAALDAGFSLIIFPEGTRGEPEKIQPFKPGIGVVLSQRPDIKFIPAFMTGMGKAMPKGDNLIVPYNSTLTFGHAMSIKENKVSEIMIQIEDEMNKLKNSKS